MRRALILSTLILAVAACGDGEGSGAPYIRATVNGQAWSATAQEGIVVYSVDSPDASGKIFTIATRTTPGGWIQSISFNLPVPPDTGSYPLDGEVSAATYSSCPAVVDCIGFRAVAEHPGTLTITRVEGSTGMIEGTFAFDGYTGGEDEAPLPITAGRFRIYAPSVFILE